MQTPTAGLAASVGAGPFLRPFGSKRAKLERPTFRRLRLTMRITLTYCTLTSTAKMAYQAISATIRPNSSGARTTRRSISTREAT